MAEHKHSSIRGMKVVVEALRVEDFPMDQQDINYAVGDIEVDDGAGGKVAIRDLTDQLSQKQYHSAEELAQAFRAIIERNRSRLAS